jgi:hypothetical protein
LLLIAVNVLGHVALYPSIVIGFFGLFVANFLIVHRVLRQLPQRGGRVASLLWLAAFIFTPASIVAIVACARKPDLTSTVQAIIAVILVGYIWFLVYRLRRWG